MLPFNDPAELALFLDDFGADCIGPGGASFKGIFDAPGDNLTVGEVLITDTTPTLLVRSVDLQALGLVKGSRIAVDGKPFFCKDFKPEDDGAFTRINLSDLK